MPTPPDFTAYTPLAASSLNAVGMWKVTTATATNQSTLSINNCFTTAYDNYRIIFTLTAVSGNVNFYWRLRASGTDSSAGYYWGNIVVGTLGTSAVNANSPRPAAQVNPSFLSSAIPQGTSTIEISRPHVTGNTPYTFIENFNDTTDQQIRSGGGIHLVNSAYDGITFGVASGATMSGIARVYGYRN
jgi:hypothetical protein